MKPRCWFLRVRQAGDEAEYYCTEYMRWCLVEAGYPCETYQVEERKIKEAEDGK